MFRGLLDRWPLAQQIIHGRDGTGLEARSARTRALRTKTHDASTIAGLAVRAGEMAQQVRLVLFGIVRQW